MYIVENEIYIAEKWKVNLDFFWANESTRQNRAGLFYVVTAVFEVT